MTPIDRKAVSESKLAALGLPINNSLPVIKSDDEVELRTPDELHRRLIALWAVTGKAVMGSDSTFAAYIVKHKLQDWLSREERAFILAKKPSKRECIHFSWQMEALCFVAWCAGLLDCPDVPVEESSVQSILHLFPASNEAPERLKGAIAVRTKSEILDRADFLYRLHWAVQDEVDGVIRHEGQDDWDKVSVQI
jgi:hypothetical protein